jgi:arylsulfatase A-like enzyme
MVTDNLRGDDSRVIVDRAIPFIDDAVKRHKPFFAVIWFHAPHLPVVAGAEYTRLYSQFDKYKQHYYGCITALDEQVGRLREQLRKLGVADNTMLWFCADNGPEGRAGSAPGSAGPLRGRKRDLFEGGVRVPGLLEWPAKISSPRATDVPACTSDYLPTILEVLGVEMPDRRPLDGVSLLPLIEARTDRRAEPIGFESSGQVALVDNRYKIYRDGKGRKKARAKDKQTNSQSSYMLFDLVNDPSEQNDIAAEHPDIVQRMAVTLQAWRKSCQNSLEGKDYP